MFKNGANLKKNAWYMKLLGFMWDVDYRDYPNLCPLFWSVLGSIVIFPIWAIIKLIGLIFKPVYLWFKSIGKKIAPVIGVMLIFLLLATSIFIVPCGLVTVILAVWRAILKDSILFLTAFGFCILLWYYWFSTMDYLWIKSGEGDDIKPQRSLVRRINYQIFNILYKPLELLILFIVSVYKKCCPYINWK